MTHSPSHLSVMTRQHRVHLPPIAMAASVDLRALLERPGAGTLVLQCSDGDLVVSREAITLASPLLADMLSSLPPASKQQKTDESSTPSQLPSIPVRHLVSSGCVGLR